MKKFRSLFLKRKKGYALLGLSVLGFILVGLVSLLLQKNIYTKNLETARMERKVLFLELDSLLQTTKKEIANLSDAELAVKDNNFLYLEVDGRPRWRVKRSEFTTKMEIDFRYIPKDLYFRRIISSTSDL